MKVKLTFRSRQRIKKQRRGFIPVQNSKNKGTMVIDKTIDIKMNLGNKVTLTKTGKTKSGL